MNSIGVDLHKKIITVCVMNDKLNVLARKTLYCEKPDEIVEFVVVGLGIGRLWLWGGNQRGRLRSFLRGLRGGRRG